MRYFREIMMKEKYIQIFDNRMRHGNGLKLCARENETERKSKKC